MTALPCSSASSLPPDRRGRLRNGATPGDFLAAARCGAQTRAGDCCRQPAMRNGRCRMHGGLSTGPRTPDGLARCRATRLVHGCRTRAGCACRQPAMRNGRCRMHGGMSTGPRTPEGRERCRRARLTHGGYSAHVRALRVAARAHQHRVRALAALMRGRPAGHGVHRSISATPLLVPSVQKINHRGHRGHRVGSTPARAARHHPSSVSSVRSVVNPSSAGHGLHPSFSSAPLSPRARRLLAGAAPLAAFSAGHGVLRSFLASAPVVPAGTP